MKTFCVFQAGSIYDFTNHLKQDICLRIHNFSSYGEESMEFIRRICTVKDFYPAHDTACLCIDLICQFAVGIMSSIYISKYRFQKSEVRDLFICKVFQVKHQIQISDSVCRNLMIQEQTSVYIESFIGKRCDLFSDVFSFQHRDTLCSFRIFRCFLILFEVTGLLYHRSFFILGK